MNISNRTIVALMGAVAVSALAACSPGSNTKHSQTPQNTQEIFSDRTAGLTTELIMVQLDLPPLLETSGSAEELQAVLHEQEQFEQKLFQISSEIRVVYRYKYTLNGFALATPAHLIPEILQAVNGKTVERAMVALQEAPARPHIVGEGTALPVAKTDRLALFQRDVLFGPQVETEIVRVLDGFDAPHIGRHGKLNARQRRCDNQDEP